MSNFPPPTPDRPIDPLLQQRIANARRPVAAPTPAAATGRAPRRVKPAKGAKVASLALSAVTTLGLTAAFAHASGSDSEGSSLVLATAGTDVVAASTAGTAATTATTSAGSSASTTAATTATTATSATAATAATTATTVATTTASGQIADGTYLGDASTNRWGTVQVQAVYSGGQLVDVQILSYPDGDRKSIQINERALPTLITEAISIQSSDVNTVSGATYTTVSYRESLQSAIDAALAASGLA